MTAPLTRLASLSRLALLSLGLFAAAGSCTAPRRAASAQCVFNSDCADGLFCISSQCRVQCMTDRDCDSVGTGLRCATELARESVMSNPHPVCVASDDYYCAYDSDCLAAGLGDHCLPSGECGVECESDYDCRNNARNRRCDIDESARCVECVPNADPTRDTCAADFGAGMRCQGVAPTGAVCRDPDGGAADASTPDATPPAD